MVVCYRSNRALLEHCVASLRHQSVGAHLVLVDDSSKERPVVADGEAITAVKPIRNKTWSGYTKTANRGLQAARDREIILLLNSDTVMPEQGVEKLVRAVKSAPDVGLAGPLSNAASWQSVPVRFKTGGSGWSTNPGLERLHATTMDQMVEAVSERVQPQVPLLNGFCLAMRREVIDEIGLLDEENFPIGYGEENDYVIRAREAGFKCVVADDTFVYHAKSQSFGNLRRWWYSRRGGIALARKWGQHRIEAMCEEMRGNPTLAYMRRAVAEELERRGHGKFQWD